MKHWTHLIAYCAGLFIGTGLGVCLALLGVAVSQAVR